MDTDLIQGRATTTGVVNVYIAKLSVGITEIKEGDLFFIVFHFTNTGTATLNINGIGASPIVDQFGNVLEENSILQNVPQILKRTGANFQIMGILSPYKPSDGFFEVIGQIKAKSKTGTALLVSERFNTTSFNGMQLFMAGVVQWTNGQRNDSTDDIVLFNEGTSAEVWRVQKADNHVKLTSTIAFTTGTAANMFIDGSGFLFISTSSKKYKRDIDYQGVDWRKILALKPVSFKDKKDKKSPEFIGFIAEDVHEVEPRLVTYIKNKPNGLNYGNFTALNTAAIQHLVNEIEELKKKINILESKSKN